MLFQKWVTAFPKMGSSFCSKKMTKQDHIYMTNPR